MDAPARTDLLQQDPPPSPAERRANAPIHAPPHQASRDQHGLGPSAWLKRRQFRMGLTRPVSEDRVVDADHPWLGLEAFTEATQQYFFGRDAEIAEIFVRTRENAL